MASLLRTVCGRAAWVGALWLVVTAGSALAEEPKSTKSAETKPAEGNPWALNCSSGSTGTELQCQVSQNLTEAKTGQRVLTVTVRRDNGNGNLAMLLALPHGLFLPSGASYQIDQGQKTTIAIQTSDQNGAYAATPLSADLVKAMKSGTNLNIGIESVTRKPVTIPVSLAGFTAAIDKLQALK
ncbi:MULTISPECIES: invasion associated locus B family protein [unclassified Mesorhizobium]|uniref:invasion associated locus B family protein n=1 Tax=unclassified Mesorhizobium TaxID=325217 RepID=UPI0004CDFA6F|nr:invasion associated locus B family protein [Mesorhizobium sp. L2C067A000]